jgi:hypothetical protein
MLGTGRMTATDRADTAQTIAIMGWQTPVAGADDDLGCGARIAFSCDSSNGSWVTGWLFQFWILWACEPGSPRAVQLPDR